MIGEMMKTVLNRLRRDETGQALILALIMLLLGGLIMAPLLGFMGTGLIAGQAYEKRTAELYAADAGIEDAIWQIITKAAGLPQNEDDPPMPPYSIADVNGKQFEEDAIVIEYIDERTYRIESTATSTDIGSSTTIESYVNILSLTDFMNNSITSKNDVKLQPGSQVVGGEVPGLGDVVYGGEADPPPDDQVEDGEVREITEEELNAWPAWDDLVLYYLQALADESVGEPFEEGEIDIKDTPEIGPLYVEGDLNIDNTENADPLPRLTLMGTVYVTGDLTFEQSGSKHYEVDLKGNTIFVEGAITFPADCCHLYGPGCIIAKGDIDFQPKMESWGEMTTEDFIFVMSVEETVSFKPQGDFYGSLAGNIEVNLQPNCTLTWNGPPPTLKYPGSDPSDINVIQAIRTWEIDLQ